MMEQNLKIETPQFGDYQYQTSRLGIPFAPLGMPVGVPSVTVANKFRVNREPLPIAMPGMDLPRAINYYADHGGCGYWRMIWPEDLINAYQKGIVMGLTTMNLDDRFYKEVKAIRLQRQATPVQLAFVKYLNQGAKEHGFKVIYEIDDIIFKDDIPDYNRCKMAFANEEIFQSAKEMMQISNEVSVTCDYMKQYYIDKTGNKNITVIPNYPPKYWMDRFYNEDKLGMNYIKHKKLPRIGYCGSGTHFDLANKTNQQDDFGHVIQQVIKSRGDFRWVFMGSFPLQAKPFIDSGEMEYAGWSHIYDYPSAMNKLNLNAVVAPLQDNHFNRAKSEIKFLEAACLGIPGVFQDLPTYKNSFMKFKTGPELVDQLKALLKDKDTYMKMVRKSRGYADTMWLDDHLDEYMELYFTNFGDPTRKALIKNNPEQANTNSSIITTI